MEEDWYAKQFARNRGGNCSVSSLTKDEIRREEKEDFKRFTDSQGDDKKHISEIVEEGADAFVSSELPCFYSESFYLLLRKQNISKPIFGAHVIQFHVFARVASL